ncbi:MAG: superoxide dismutase family protein [Thermodesulfobacteriota bacterium]
MRMFACLCASALFLGAAAPNLRAESAAVQLVNTEGDRVGEAKLTQTPHGVLIALDLSKAPPGTHALHIHEVGKCEPPFESAGEHFNPFGKQHGFLDEKGRHAGDLPNIHVPQSGELTVEVLATRVTLREGENRLFDDDGSALVIHEQADDYRSDPAGDAGARIACGVIADSSS